MPRWTIWHAILGATAAVELVRALHQSYMREIIPDDTVRFVLLVVLPIASTTATLLAIALGLRTSRPRRAFVADLWGLAAAYAAVFLLSTGYEPREAVLFLVVAVLVVRFAPSVRTIASLARRVDRPVVGPRSWVGPQSLGIFLAINAVLIVGLAAFPLPSIGSALRGTGPGGLANADVARSLLTRWFPFALAVATALAVALARGSHEPQRILSRHFWLYLALPAAAALVFLSDARDPSIFGSPYIALVASMGGIGLLAVWRARVVRSDRAIGLLLGAVTLASALALLPFDRTLEVAESDEPHYLLIMDSLVHDHDLDLKNNYDAADYGDYYGGQLPDRHVIVSGTRELPIRDLGLPLLGALPFAIARRTGVLIVMCLIGGAFAWRSYAFLRYHAFSRHSAIIAAGIVALLHPVLTYTTQIYPDLPVALGVVLVAELLARPVTAARLAAASAILGALPWFTVRAWFIVVGMGLVVAWIALSPLFRGVTRRRLRLVAAGGAPFLAFLGALVGVDYLLFGIPVPNAGYYLIQGAQTVLAYTPQIGISGLFLDRTFGLLSRVPVFALAFFGAVPLIRRVRVLRSPGLVALFLGWLFYLVYIGDVQYWWADGSPSSRYQLATIALPLTAIAAGLDRLRGAAGPALVWAAAAWSASVTLLFALIPSVRYDLASEVAASGGPGRLWIHVTQTLRADPGLLFPSLVRAAPVDALFTVAWLFVLGGIVALGARSPKRRSDART